MMREFHMALGQFMNYRCALESEDPERTLYLALPNTIYDDFFTQIFPQQVIQRYEIPMLIYSIQTGEIEQWQANTNRL